MSENTERESVKRECRKCNVWRFYYDEWGCVVYQPLRPDRDFDKEVSYASESKARRIARGWYGYSMVCDP
jgi:hypothetical protein